MPGQTHRSDESRVPSHDSGRSSTAVLRQSGQVHQQAGKLGMWNQPPEFLPTETGESISNLISNAGHMLGREGKAMTGRREHPRPIHLHRLESSKSTDDSTYRKSSRKRKRILCLPEVDSWMSEGRKC